MFDKVCIIFIKTCAQSNAEAKYNQMADSVYETKENELV